MYCKHMQIVKKLLSSIKGLTAITVSGLTNS